MSEQRTAALYNAEGKKIMEFTEENTVMQHIAKLTGYKNGYMIIDNSDEKALNEELKTIYRNYRKLNCIITNEDMFDKFQPSSFLGHRTVVKNNKIPENCFFINGVW